MYVDLGDLEWGRTAFPNFSFDCLKVCNTNSHAYIHSNPSNYSQLSRCLAEEPMACGSPMCKEGSHGESLPFHGIQQPRYSHLFTFNYPYLLSMDILPHHLLLISLCDVTLFCHCTQSHTQLLPPGKHQLSCSALWSQHLSHLYPLPASFLLLLIPPPYHHSSRLLAGCHPHW